MSVQAMTAVFEMRGLAVTERLVLLGFANYADKSGRNSYPSVPTVADDCEVDERTVRRALRRLEARGFIERDGMDDRAVGGRRAVRYRIVMGEGAARPLRGDRRPDTAPPDPVIRSLISDPDLKKKIGSDGSGGRLPPLMPPQCADPDCDHSLLRRDWPCVRAAS